MSEIKVFSTRIYPTKSQIEYFRKAFGIRRYLWNWGIDITKQELNNGNIRPSNFSLAKLCNHTLLEDGNHEWIKEVHHSIRKQVFKELDTTYKNYFKNLKSMKTNTTSNKVYGQPRYQSKKICSNSFTIQKNTESIFANKYITNKHFLMPTIGRERINIKTSESIRFLRDDNIDIKLVTIKEYPINTFTIFITYERTNHKVNKPNTNTKIGIDMGMKTPLTCYDGENTYKLNPLDRIKKAEKKREKYNKKLSIKLDSYKKQQKSKAYNKGFKFKESKRYIRTKQQLQKAYYKEECIKRDFREKTTTWLVTNYHTINIEPFTNGFKNSNRAVSRISQYLFYERLKQKAELYKGVINCISWEPTTQTCSSCNHRFTNKEKLTLNSRKYICPNCNLTLDRDINAAINIYNLK